MLGDVDCRQSVRGEAAHQLYGRAQHFRIQSTDLAGRQTRLATVGDSHVPDDARPDRHCHHCVARSRQWRGSQILKAVIANMFRFGLAAVGVSVFDHERQRSGGFDRGRLGHHGALVFSFLALEVVFHLG